MLSQIFQAPQDTIEGVETSDWFGPLQPVKPIAPEGTQPRSFQYNPGQNLTYTPRAQEVFSANELRGFSTYDMVRVIIENVKDQLSRMPVKVKPKREPGEKRIDYDKRVAKDDIAKQLQELVDFPNTEQIRSEFVRKITDDMLVIDAPAILIGRKGNKVTQLRPLDGATITRYIDEQGFTPAPPSPAYAQLWYGIPMVDLTTDQLLYAPRNVLTYRLYGYSPTEQAVTWIKIGSERLRFQLSYYTEGSVPDAIQIVPPGVPPENIDETQQWLTSDLAGQLAKKRQWRLIQGFQKDGHPDQVLFPKEKLLSDPFDDLVIRCLCFAFGTSPQRLMRMMNRATAEANQDAAETEGMLPWVNWLQDSVYNRLIQRVLGQRDYEAVIDPNAEPDATKQAAVDKSDVSVGIRTIDEAREDRGLDAYSLPETSKPIIITGTGPIPLDASAAAERAGALADAARGPEPAAGEGGPPKPGKNDKTPSAAEKKARQRKWRY